MNDQHNDSALLRSIFDASIEGILVVDEKGIILMANNSGEGMFGYAVGELQGKKLEKLLPEKFKKQHGIHREMYAKKPETRHMGIGLDLWGLKKDGTEFPLDIGLNPSAINNRPVTVAYIKDATARMMDITALQETNAILQQTNFSLQESNRKYGTLIDNLQGIVFRCRNDRNYTMEYISVGCLPITDYKPQEFLKEKVQFGQIIVPDDRDRAWNDIQKAIAEKRPFDLIFRIHDKRGNIKYMRETGRAIFNTNGNIEVLEGFMADVTEQKKVAFELAKEKEMLQKYIHTAASIFVVINKDQNIELINQKGCEILGWPRNEILNKNWFESFIPKKEKRKITALFNEIIHGNVEPPDLYENVILTKSKKRKLIQWRSAILKDDKGKVLALLISGVDITEQKKVELELQLSESKNRAILQAMPDLLFIISEQGVYLDAHVPDPALLFVTKDELIGKNITDHLPKDISERVMAAFQKSKKTGLPQMLEHQLSIKEEQKYFESRITAIDEESFLVITRDITNKKQEELLKDQIRTILGLITEDKSLEKIAHKIIETVERHVGNCMASILVLDEEQQTLNKLAVPNLPEGFNKGIEGVGIGDRVGSCGTAAFLKKEVIVADIANDPLWTEHKELALEHGLKSCWSSPILSSKKKVLGTFAIYCDHVRTPQKNEREIVADMTQLASVAIEQYNINETLQKNREQLEEYAHDLEDKVAERTKEVTSTVQKLVEANLNLEDQIMTTKAAENKALASQALFNAIAKNFPKGAISVFNTDMEFVHVDGEDFNNFDFDKTDFEGKRVDDVPLLPEKLKNKIKGDIQKTLSGKHLSFELEFDGESYSANSIPLYADKEITWALFVYSNITDQKRVQHELRKALEIEQELNELKSRFISMASHEFRTPLSAILSSAILIGKQNEAGKEEKRRKYVKQIENNVRNLVVILNDFLSLSKLEEGKIAFHPELFDMVALSESILDEIENSKKKGQDLFFEYSPDTISVDLDPKLMRHVLTNLLSNAIKYSEENTSIHVKIKSNDEKILITVTDQGIGISKEEQEFLFGRFFRAKNATNIQGTGLGLHIVKQYTELMGGTVSFTSEVDKGSTFNVELPVSGR